MNDRAVSLFEKYGIDAEKTRKGRGSIIVQTGSGQLMLTEYSGPCEQLRMEYELLNALSGEYDRPLDIIHKTLEEELYCVDYEGKKYILKEYVEGREINVSDPIDHRRAADGLARLHLALRRVQFAAKEGICCHADNLMEDFDRRSAELLRARNYMRKLPRKDDFELAFLHNYDIFWEQTMLIREFLDEACLERLKEQQLDEHMLIHGDCNQHNILVQEDEGVAVVNFERTGAHLQVKDLYLFMRKILEKNDWAYEVGENLLSAYQTVLPLTKEERSYLYARFLYPEKFWKVANGYLNKRKALPARRQQEKLLAALEKEEKRQMFLTRWVETCR